jgi:hypothetical protein
VSFRRHEQLSSWNEKKFFYKANLLGGDNLHLRVRLFISDDIRNLPQCFAGCSRELGYVGKGGPFFPTPVLQY